MKINVGRIAMCAAGFLLLGNMMSLSTPSVLRCGSSKFWSSIHKVPALSVSGSFLGTFALDMRKKGEEGREGGEERGGKGRGKKSTKMFLCLPLPYLGLRSYSFCLLTIVSAIFSSMTTRK